MKGYEITVKGDKFPFQAKLVFRNENLEKWTSSSVSLSTDCEFYTERCVKRRFPCFSERPQYYGTLWDFRKW
ncbi:hypothetical protein HHI36_017752 [Cryptolaemus montrouzieri]|uniref:Uncharacterized protein n=1 Tax=Cryptolaemus montrouzieri TaxID=559131 RepID=A0ABD2NPA0_9CUCU